MLSTPPIFVSIASKHDKASSPYTCEPTWASAARPVPPHTLPHLTWAVITYAARLCRDANRFIPI